MSWYGYKPYVSVAERKAQALREMQRLLKEGKVIEPIEIQGRKIARNFWGEAWCEHLESFGDYANRIPRGRTYVRNGSVCHLGIEKGSVSGFVAGSELYEVEVSITPLPKKKWLNVKQGCTNQISSLLDLLQGKIPDSVMQTVTNQKEGLFPTPKEIKFSCDCPDYAHMCKHIAAVLYGIGARLDHSPELLFELRGVDVEELIDSEAGVASATKEGDRSNRISIAGLDDVFGIEIDDQPEIIPKRTAKKKAASTQKKTAAARKPAAKKKLPHKKAAQRGAGARLKPINVEDVIDLRNRLEVGQCDLARLIGVSRLTVSKWESQTGQLNLRETSLRSFKRVQKLSIKKALAELEVE